MPETLLRTRTRIQPWQSIANYANMLDTLSKSDSAGVTNETTVRLPFVFRGFHSLHEVHGFDGFHGSMESINFMGSMEYIVIQWLPWSP